MEQLINLITKIGFLKRGEITNVIYYRKEIFSFIYMICIDETENVFSFYKMNSKFDINKSFIIKEEKLNFYDISIIKEEFKYIFRKEKIDKLIL